MADGPRFELPPHRCDFAERRLAKPPKAFASSIEVVRRTNDTVHGATEPATSSRMHSTRAPRASTRCFSTAET